MLVASVAGLLTAEVVLRFARQELRGRFISRYAAMVLGVTLGEAFTVLLPAIFVAVLLTFVSSEGIGVLLLRGGSFTVLGGALGMIEGLVLAYPLAAILGRLRSAAG